MIDRVTHTLHQALYPHRAAENQSQFDPARRSVADGNNLWAVLFRYDILKLIVEISSAVSSLPPKGTISMVQSFKRWSVELMAQRVNEKIDLLECMRKHVQILKRPPPFNVDRIRLGSTFRHWVAPASAQPNL